VLWASPSGGTLIGRLYLEGRGGHGTVSSALVITQGRFTPLSLPPGLSFTGGGIAW
jgi:hypothetical protein